MVADHFFSTSPVWGSKPRPVWPTRALTWHSG